MSQNISKSLRICKNCGQLFLPKSNNQFYCSTICDKIQYNIKRRNGDHFRTNYCLYCGKELKDKNTSRRYCPGGVCYKLYRCLKRRKQVIRTNIKREKKLKIDVFLKEYRVLYKQVKNQWYWVAYKCNKQILQSNFFISLKQAQQDSRRALL